MKDKHEYTKAEWFAEGERRFGTSDARKWRFICPSCSKIRSTEDYMPHKESGAKPASVYQECVGRFTGGRNGPDKCDWASYGLFRGPSMVVDDDGVEVFVFDFAEA